MGFMSVIVLFPNKHDSNNCIPVCIFQFAARRLSFPKDIVISIFRRFTIFITCCVTVTPFSSATSVNFFILTHSFSWLMVLWHVFFCAYQRLKFKVRYPQKIHTELTGYASP